MSSFATIVMNAVLRTQISAPLRWKKEIERSNVPMLVLVSWLDAGTTEGAPDRLRSFRNPQKLVIMASSHGGGAHASPFVVDSTPVRGNPTQDEMAQMRLQFFDRYLKGVQNGVDAWPTVRYCTLGAEDYRESATWPLPGTTVRRLFLAANGTLTSSAPTQDGATATSWTSGSTPGRAKDGRHKWGVLCCGSTIAQAWMRDR